MTATDHARDEERLGHRIYRRLMLQGVLSVSKLLLTSLGELKRLRAPQATDERYIRPPRDYELPAYRAGMEASRSTARRSGARYLRPTRYCDPRAPQVVALAHALGAYRLPPRAYAEAAFAFVKERLELEIGPIGGVVRTLERGTGTCFELISVWIALLRAAGVPARYKIYATQMIQAWRESTVDADPLAKKWYDSLGYFLLEGEGEAFIDGQWRVAHVGPSAARQAAAGIPITRFGEDALGVWFHARPGTIMRLEALPWGLAGGSRLLHMISPGSLERVNIGVQKAIARGRRVLEEAGGEAAYDEQARRRAATAGARAG